MKDTNKEKNSGKSIYSRIFIVTVVVISLLMMFMVGYLLHIYYASSVNQIEILGEKNIDYETAKVEGYLQKGMDVVWVTADSVSNMLERGVSNEDILEYLTAEAEHEASQIDENFTGIYGYINGEYLDGIGWVPPEGYEPQSRDWYTAAIDAHGETVIVAPYVDAQTNTVMISIARMLSDGVSVVSLDVELNEVQTITENIKLNGAGYGFVMDDDGLVVAHLDKREKGKVYTEIESRKDLARAVKEVKNGFFKIMLDNEECRVFTSQVMDDWHVVMVVSDTKLFNEIRKQMYIALFLSLVVFSIIIVYCLYFYIKMKRHMELDEANKERLADLNRSIIGALAYTIDAKDRYTSGHSQRVANYALEIARRMGKSEKELQDIYFAGLLHDVGKIRVSEEVINKPGKLTDEEFNQIKVHPVSGFHILKDIYKDYAISVGAKYHHERFDGKGYPNGLEGDNIPEIARIIGVADSYDAMASNRSYRNALPQHIVRAEIEKGSGSQFDPEIAEIMLNMIDEDKKYEMCQKPMETKNILIIDDENFNLKMATRILSKEDEAYQLFTALSYEEAEKIMDENEIDLVLLDLMMPDIDGYEAYSLIKSKKDVPIVITTADKTKEAVEKTLDMKAADYLTKPFIPIVLKEVVHDIIYKWMQE